MNGVTGAGRASTSKKGHHGEVYTIYILMLFNRSIKSRSRRWCTEFVVERGRNCWQKKEKAKVRGGGEKERHIIERET